jgi:hypothetical protein
MALYKVECSCPVMAEYLSSISRTYPHHTVLTWSSLGLGELVESLENSTSPRRVQLLRAFCCLKLLYAQMVEHNRHHVGLELRELKHRGPTREALREMLSVSSAVGRACTSILTADRLLVRVLPTSATYDMEGVEGLADLAELTSKACIYLRPRLRNGEPVARIAKYLANAIDFRGLSTMQAARIARILANTTTAAGIAGVENEPFRVR